MGSIPEGNYLAKTLSNIDGSSFSNASDRVNCLKAAEGLVRRLQDPWERMYRITCYQPILLSMMKTAADLDLFNQLNKSPQSSAQLGEKTGCDPDLMYRILRLLSLEALVIQDDGEDKWTESELSCTLRDPEGLISGIGFFYDVGLQTLGNLPGYLNETQYRNPSNNTQSPIKYWNPNDLDFWEAYNSDAAAHSRFNNWLHAVRVDQTPWPEYYPISNILDGYLDEEKPLAVDVGGGKGVEMRFLVDALPKGHSHRRVVLQDLCTVLKQAKDQPDMPPNMEYVAHDFFQPQPPETRGSKVYYLRNVLHDWSDEDCRKILLQLKDAMIPGYSKILLREAVLPMRAVDTDLHNGALDIMMMSFFGTRERTETQWRAMIESVGLRFISFTPSPGTVSGIIQVEI